MKQQASSKFVKSSNNDVCNARTKGDACFLAPIRNSVQQQDFPGMLSAGYFHPFSSHVAASFVGIDNDREGQRSGYQLPPEAGQNLIKIGSFLREQKFFTSSKLQRLLNFHFFY
jgi:hypothetical protein